MNRERKTNTQEIEELKSFWENHNVNSKINITQLAIFLYIFSPEEIKGAMFLAIQRARWQRWAWAYCRGILFNWRDDLMNGITNRIIKYQDQKN